MEHIHTKTVLSLCWLFLDFCPFVLGWRERESSWMCCCCCCFVVWRFGSVYIYIWSHIRNILHFVLCDAVFFSSFCSTRLVRLQSCLTRFHYVPLENFMHVSPKTKLDLFFWHWQNGKDTFGGYFLLALPYSHMNVKSNIFHKASSTHLHAHTF